MSTRQIKGASDHRARLAKQQAWYLHLRGCISDNRREYWDWLNGLARLVGYHWQNPDATGPGPFRELILYGRHTGTIGAIASAKLVADFGTWDERARPIKDDAFYEHYALKRSMFEYAATDGAVEFRCC